MCCNVKLSSLSHSLLQPFPPLLQSHWPSHSTLPGNGCNSLSSLSPEGSATKEISYTSWRNQLKSSWNHEKSKQISLKSSSEISPTLQLHPLLQHMTSFLREITGESRGNQREIRKSRTPKLLVADPSLSPSFSFPTSPPPSNFCADITPHKSSNSLHSITRHKSETLSIIASRTLPLILSDPPSKVLEVTRILYTYSHGSSLIETLQPEVTYACAIFSGQVWIIKAVNCRALAVGK